MSGKTPGAARFQKIHYGDLNARQKENHNFHKVAGHLADYGYNSLRLNDDWQGADFLAVHVGGDEVLKIQLKGRFGLYERYRGKGLYLAFVDGDECYVYPHDEILEAVFSAGKVAGTKAWASGGYDWPRLPLWAKPILAPYRL